MANAAAETAGAAARRARTDSPAARGKLAAALKRNGPGYLFLLPWLVGFFGLTLIPTAASLYLSFTNYDLLTPPRWTGLFNYSYAFLHDDRFRSALSVTFHYVLWSVPLKLSASPSRSPWCLTAACAASASIGRCSTCPRCSARRSPSQCCGFRSSATRASSTRSWRSSGFAESHGSPTPTTPFGHLSRLPRGSSDRR